MLNLLHLPQDLVGTGVVVIPQFGKPQFEVLVGFEVAKQEVRFLPKGFEFIMNVCHGVIGKFDELINGHLGVVAKLG